MIYALVEPSIYMIASILPTTRHLYRRVRRKARQTAQLRNTRSNGGPKNSSLYRSADGERIGSRETTSREITQHVDTWQAHTNSSQEELRLEESYQSQQEWNQMRDYEKESDKGASDTGPRDFVEKQIEVRDQGRPIR
jgi:hypothetical protein